MIWIRRNKPQRKCVKCSKVIGNRQTVCKVCLVNIMEYTREKLIEICERAVVAEKDWCNRDSSDAQIQLGKAWALLKADCKYWVRQSGGNCSTDKQTIWIEIEYKGFNYFEYGSETANESETFYLPTEARLEQAKSKDWY